MTKYELLNHLASVDNADAREIASTFDLPYSTAAMALLRLTRQGLIARYLDPDNAVYWYSITEQGEKRLNHFRAIKNFISGENYYAP